MPSPGGEGIGTATRVSRLSLRASDRRHWRGACPLGYNPYSRRARLLRTWYRSAAARGDADCHDSVATLSRNDSGGAWVRLFLLLLSRGIAERSGDRSLRGGGLPQSPPLAAATAPSGREPRGQARSSASLRGFSRLTTAAAGGFSLKLKTQKMPRLLYNLHFFV